MGPWHTGRMINHSSYAVALVPRLARCYGLAVAMLLLSLTVTQTSAADHYLFTSFRGNGEDGLHLALSTDGYHWTALKQDASFLRPEIGGKLMRDPSLAQGPDGVFHLVWTTGWTAESGKVFGYASSTDLVHWSPQRGIKVMENEPKTRNIWAPELFYDAGKEQWLIFWSSTVPGKYAATDRTGDDGYNHRIYYVTTKDFVQFSESKLLYDPGFNCIDATLVAAEGRFYLFFKDERKTPLQKKLRYAVAANAEGPFGPPSEPFTGDWVEGPSVIKIGQEWLVYFDHYATPQFYGGVRSADLKTWQDCSKEMQFPAGQRHGTVLKIPERISAGLGAQASPVVTNRPVVIFDTDMGSDVDDAGALAVLHRLADLGEVEIAGVIFSSGKNRYGVGVCDAINTWYGRGNLPLGQYQPADVGDPKNYYSREIAMATNEYHHKIVDRAPDAVGVYKAVLRSARDGSVTIVTVGHPHVLVWLLHDAEGGALVSRKVARWVAMGGTPEKPGPDWNLGANGVSAYMDELLLSWPTEVYFSPVGETVVTGNRKLPAAPANNPVREAYRLWNDALEKGRSSWDHVAVLYAVRPEMFEVQPGMMRHVAGASVVWDPKAPHPKHHRVQPKISESALAEMIEDLMAAPPNSARR
jgi:hypothetical protein